jgi:hypothetical protein
MFFAYVLTGWRISHDWTESESYVTTDGQSASLSWNKAPTWGSRPDLYYCQTIEDLLMWGALSDKRTGLSFTISAGPRQSSCFRVRLPWDFTVSDSRLTFRRLLRLAGLRWRYSTPPPHGITTIDLSHLQSLGTDRVENNAPHCWS